MALADYIGKYWAGAEVIYGVIIAMTFTSVLRGNPVVFEQMLYKTVLGALFCCIAWGIADGLFYYWERSYILRQENTVIELSKSPEGHASAVALVEEELDDTILRNIPREKRLDLFGQLVNFLSGVGERKKLTSRESATILLGTFSRSAGAGLVVVLPFFVIPDVEQALKISNLLGIFLLFGVGYFRAPDRSIVPRITSGIGTSLLGIIIAGITVVLGG